MIKSEHMTLLVQARSFEKPNLWVVSKGVCYTAVCGLYTHVVCNTNALVLSLSELMLICGMIALPPVVDPLLQIDTICLHIHVMML